MAQAFRIETLDRSGRWYLTPGGTSIYDLRVRNDSKNLVECSLVVEDPAAGVNVEPNAFTLLGHEVRTVTVTFTPAATSARCQRVLFSLRSDNDGSVLATFEHPIVITGGTDCSVVMAWKDVLIEAGELRGFEIACSLRSQSEATSSFQLSLSPHPALAAPELPVLSLEPGQVAEIIIPIRWNRAIKDEAGWNHPSILEVAVPVSNGRRTSRVRWEYIESRLEPYLKRAAPSVNGAVASASAAIAPEPASAPPPTPQSSPASPSAPRTAPPLPTLTVAGAKKEAEKPPMMVVPSTMSARPASPAPPSMTESVAPAAQAAATPADGAPVAPPRTTSPAPAASISDEAAAKTPPAPAQAQDVKSPTAAVGTPSAPLLMLNRAVQLLMLAAPVDSKPAPASMSATIANSRIDTAKPAEPIANAMPPAEVIELSLFPELIATGAQPVAPTTSGSRETVEPQPVAAAASPSPTAQQPDAPAAAAPPPPVQQADAAAVTPPPAAQKLDATAAAPPRPAPKLDATAAIPPPTAQPDAPAATPTPAAQQVADAAATPPASAQRVDAAATTPPTAAQPQVSPLADEPPAPLPSAPVAPPAAAAEPTRTVEPAPTLQWKIGRDAPADVSTPAAPTWSPAAEPSPANAAAAASSSAAAAEPAEPVEPAQSALPAATTAARPAKLTPYSAAKWDGSDYFTVPPPPHMVPPQPAVETSAPLQVPQTPAPPITLRERQKAPARPSRPIPSGVLIGGATAISLVVAGVLIFKPFVSTLPVSVRPHVGADAGARIIHAEHKPAVAPNTVKPKIVAQAPLTAAPTAAPATPTPATPKPATPAPAKPVVALRPSGPAHAFRNIKLYTPETGSVVALGTVEAYYGPRGRIVRVLWGAAEQASANIQLIDDHGATVSSANVRGGRQTAVLYLPRGYHGALTVQVSSVGRLGERVANTTSLPPFGY